MGSVEALQAYWSSPAPIAALAIHATLLAGLGLLYYGTSRPSQRLRLLYSVYAVDVSLWSFLAASFLLCVVLSERVEYETTGLKLTASLSIFGGLIAGAFSGAVLTMSQTARQAHLTKLDVEESATEAGGPAPALVVSDRPGILAASSSLYEPVVIVSRRLGQLLSADELEAVLAHEIAHLANRDSRRRLASTILSKCLFFDPLSKFVDPAIYRQGELLADHRAASDSRRARALAAALRRLGSVCGSEPAGRRLAGLLSRHVPLETRLRRLTSGTQP